MTPVSVCVHPIARRGPGRRGKNSGCRGLERRWTRQPLLARPVHSGHGSVESEDVQTPDDEGGRMRPRELVSTARSRSEEHTSELQSRLHLVCRLLLEKKKEARCTVGD